jgi:cell division protein FtsZ
MIETNNPLDSLRAPANPQPARQPGQASVKVIGLGGGGSNAVNRMIELGLQGIDFIAANTDHQALASSLAPLRIQLGPKVTRGLGAGGDPRIGAAAAMESSRDIASALQGADMVFITAGMGGGTGTGAVPVAAEIAREAGAVVISVVTLPFSFEMTRRSQNALEGVKKLQPHSHTLITVPNDRLLQVVPRDISLEIAFRLADDVLRQGVQAIAELITHAGLINVDFANVRQLMLHGGGALMAIGIASGDDKSNAAIYQALHHPLLDIESLDQASGVLAHFTGGDDLTLYEIGEAVGQLRQKLSPEAEVILGATTDEAMNGRTQVILIVTGIGARPAQVVSPIQPAKQATPQTSMFSHPGSDPDLDLPTFLRRRISIGSLQEH